MGLVDTGLTNGGRTEHFSIAYDDSLPPDQGLGIAEQLVATCEDDFAMMLDWFSGQTFEFDFPINVNLSVGDTGASWDNPIQILLPFGYNPTVTVKAGPSATADLVRYLVVQEITEMLMVSKDNGWCETSGLFNSGDEGSKGEGLSRFLGLQFKIINNTSRIRYTQSEVVKYWLNSAGQLQSPPVPGQPGRTNYVDSDVDDNQPDAVTGCATAFIFYLHSQLDFSIQKIINAGAETLAGVYTNLTGRTDGWTSFIGLVNQHYPSFTAYDVPGDNLFPVASLANFQADPVLSGSSGVATLSLDNQAPAEAVITLTSDAPALVAVSTSLTIPPGQWSAQVPLAIAAVIGPAQTTTIHASYAGLTLNTVVQVLPRPSTLSGQVTDSDGLGLPDATVQISPDEPSAGVGASVQLSTDGNGNYQAPPLAPGAYVVSASQGSYVPQQTSVAVVEGVPDTVVNFALDLTLPFTLEGQVTSTAGTVVAGATLTLSDTQGSEDWVQTTTDPAGAYSLTMLPTAYIRIFALSVTAPGFVRIDTTVSPPNGATVDLPLQMMAFGSLSGTVKDTSGAPISGAVVSGGGVAATSDATGSYSLGGLAPGQIDLTITAVGFDALASSLVIASAADTTENFGLTPATAVITGTITNAIDLSPIVGATIQMGLRRAAADSNGVYQFTAVSAGEQTLRAGGLGPRGQQRVVEVVDHQTLVVDFSLSPPHHKGDPVPQ